MLFLFVLTTSTQAVQTVSIYSTRSHRSVAQRQPFQLSTDVALTAHISLHRTFPVRIVPTWNTLQPYLLSQTPSLPHLQAFKVGAFCFLEGHNLLWTMDSVQASLPWNDPPMNIPNLYFLRLYRPFSTIPHTIILVAVIVVFCFLFLFCNVRSFLNVRALGFSYGARARTSTVHMRKYGVVGMQSAPPIIGLGISTLGIP